MADYHFHVTQIRRSKGQSAVACAAYRSGEKLFSAITARSAITPASEESSILKYSYPYTRCPNIPTDRRYGTQSRKPSRTRKHSSHIVLTLPCKMSFLWKKTSKLQGNFY